MAEHPHIPVLFDEVIAQLVSPETTVYVDCTAGLGGHASAIARAIGGRPGAAVVLNDLDAGNLTRAEANVSIVAPGVAVHTSNDNFVAVPRVMMGLGLRADAVLADLGFASPHMDDPERGFAIKHDGPLDMRFNTATGHTAAEIVNSRSETELVDLIRRLGEEPAARRIAGAIVRRRAEAPFRTTKELANAVIGVTTRPRPGSIHPATKTFQALRIAVNDELAALDTLLEAIARAALATRTNPERSWLNPGARVAIISFHSLEDRRVKTAFKAWADRGLGRALTRSPITPTEAETEANPRSRSSKMRIFEVDAGGRPTS